MNTPLPYLKRQADRLCLNCNEIVKYSIFTNEFKYCCNAPILVQVDDSIIYQIKLLRSIGLDTAHSCSGHINDNEYTYEPYLVICFKNNSLKIKFIDFVNSIITKNETFKDISIKKLMTQVRR